MRSFANIWHKSYNTVVQSIKKRTSCGDVQPAKREKIKGGKIKVYDIVEAGPRNRFTVRGKDGKPFIVHNCCQHLARNIIAEQWLKIAKRYKVVLQVHDEVVALVPEDEAEEAANYMVEVMSTSPEWWPEIPLAAEASYGDSYGDAK